LPYRDVAPRASQVVQVTASGFMPPWLPEPGEHPFAGERSLSAVELDTLRRWAEAGAPEGDPARTPRPPEWPAGWLLGEPALILAPAEPYVLGADGTDVFRNLVVGNPLSGLRFVRAVELRPGNPAVHHAILQLDPTPSSRVLDSDDEEPGFPGMSMGSSEPPDGHFLGWRPGCVAGEVPAGMAWRLPPAGDLVLQLHMTRTGKR